MALRCRLTKIRKNTFRITFGKRWGIVRYTGSEWLAERVYYQERCSRGGGFIKKPMNLRTPRFKRVGFFVSQKLAVVALKASLK